MIKSTKEMKRPSKKLSKRLGTYSKEQDEFIDWLGMQIITKDGENQLLMDEIKELKELMYSPEMSKVLQIKELKEEVEALRSLCHFLETSKIKQALKK
jgi:hypothetical protein